MPFITMKETITKRIEIPLETVIEILENLGEKERNEVIQKLQTRPIALKPFKKDNLANIINDFSKTNLYQEDFLKDLEQGLKKSSVCK
ncbi:MAG: hypothetical protein CVU43_19930 [Chloroflexi bacterium HGW-Chloroflexi-5]|jgi:Mg/Co/Ni transporter MgtE|nr:MAG: hypothetical protein CVU54_07760 [Deltaproteobacteria bacterium HGW-Deltaproteobacteria-12]PKN96590.1 MAG: hypothetical protein CVU43_19930 [Chloroflexi bacterium HGW-Chloroflexi-5]